MYRLLDKVNSPEDIRGFSPEDLKTLCAEIRSYMIECCAKNPGHLGSSLGAVELIVGLHYVYNTPEDKIVFDVGHQAYAHKILTGRREIFRQNRKKGGISGFTKRSESEYDAFGAGHSSTSISSALGLAEAARIMGTGEKVVAIIGDGALSGGLAFEGINNAGTSKTDLLVIINDNNISIDKNIGAVHEHLLRLTTDPTYNRIKKHVWDRIGEGNFRKMIQKFIVSTKSSIVSMSGGALFEALGFRYFGPIDGNDISQVTETLSRLKDIKGPRILHTITTKGKGFAPAEEEQTIWHSPGMFDPETGKRIKPAGHNESRYQDVFGEVLLELARSDKRIVGITPAMATGCGMDLLAREIPERFFDVGIAEEHAVTFAAGLAAGGMKPFCNIYSSFSQRAYDQIIHDVALQKLGVVLCLDRSGLVGEDGATHQGVFDIAAYRSIPGTVIAAPRNETELKQLMFTASKQNEGPFIIRYPRGYGEGTDWRNSEFAMLPVGKAEKLMDGTDVIIIAAGPLANRACEASARYRTMTGANPAIYNIRYIKPIDTGLLESAGATFRTVITLEDGVTAGGLYGAVCEYFSNKADRPEIIGMGIPDRFIEQGTQAEEMKECGIDTDSIFRRIKEEMEKTDKKSQKVLESRN
ncbi:MAG: 1-deoxy-D-xylulose-5-phosphate synthase [Bacteroidetes bacterium]|uniref:1-deoxy-D-xylulose-5-phosphate synthase n=1 Tax=Candidatus Cryptobacteroides faecipullorum TaxID=2840764 RepID=A0A9D9I8Q6_9BACT|nr:1-deoxy-D-xylulose-5-phosphate synthase [Candidatus Cryptobacteroides faecipullorum]